MADELAINYRKLAEDKLRRDYRLLTVGEKWQLLGQAMVERKHQIPVVSNWDIHYFMWFLYQTIYKPKEWTEREFEILLNSYGKTDNEVAQQLAGRTAGAVAVVRAFVHNFHRGGDTSGLSNTQKQYLEESRGSLNCPKCGVRFQESPSIIQVPTYHIFGKLGSGGFSTVYRARRKDGLIVALKMPRIDPGVTFNPADF